MRHLGIFLKVHMTTSQMVSCTQTGIFPASEMLRSGVAHRAKH